MIHYLYVKTHNETGLKYLGKCVRNPYKYPGSGTYWKRHINAHGNDVTTEVIAAFDDLEDVKVAGLYHSELWNVVESDEWANLKPEAGDGGNGSANKGKHTIGGWNRGLTKADSRIAANAEAISKAKKGQPSKRKGKKYPKLHTG